jgi:hypothetical protein
VTRADDREHLSELLRQFVSFLAQPEDLQRLIEMNPVILGPEFDILMVQAAAAFRQEGESESADLLDRYRALLDECRRLGVAAGFIKLNAYTLVNGYLRAEDRESKLAYLLAHPELDDMTNRAALYQMIEQAESAGSENMLRFLQSNLQLLDLASMTSPAEAVERAYGPG